MVKHTQTIRRLLPTNCLSMFDYFVGLALKGLYLMSCHKEEKYHWSKQLMHFSTVMHLMIETSHLFRSANQMIGFYIKWNTGWNRLNGNFLILQKSDLTGFMIIHCLKYARIRVSNEPHSHRIYNSVLIRKNTGQWKPYSCIF